jgi:hypothetical protein
MEQTGCSETSAYKIQKPGNYPEESIQHSEHDESLKSRRYYLIMNFIYLSEVSKLIIRIYLCLNIGNLNCSQFFYSSTAFVSLLLLVEVPRSHSDTTLGRTPLNEWSARRRDLYVTTHNTQNRQTSMPLERFEHAIPNKRVGTDPRLRPRDRQDVLKIFVTWWNWGVLCKFDNSRLSVIFVISLRSSAKTKKINK